MNTLLPSAAVCVALSTPALSQTYSEDLNYVWAVNSNEANAQFCYAEGFLAEDRMHDIWTHQEHARRYSIELGYSIEEIDNAEMAGADSFRSFSGPFFKGFPEKIESACRDFVLQFDWAALKAEARQILAGQR
ncbi:MAG: hypothetical protein ABJN34_00540 [Litoreibacter sp.]|uniref:hypothetical protein n=1 Tax=Litoreibacter sp. TaxID=1969459 RepID=UPI003298F7AB